MTIDDGRALPIAMVVAGLAGSGVILFWVQPPRRAPSTLILRPDLFV